MEPLRADLFDPASLAALGRIEIVARWIVDGFMSGLHRSPRKGFSVEFAEYRPYQPGDDPRYIDYLLDFWFENFERFLAGKKLKNIVDYDDSRATTRLPFHRFT